MDDKKTTPKASNAGWSVYDAHKQWAKQKAEELTKKLGKPVSASEVVREALDKLMKKESK